MSELERSTEMSSALSEEKIHDRGVIRNVLIVLDDSEDRGPCGHWADTSGRRLYSLDRVVAAEDLLQNKEGLHFVRKDAKRLNENVRPVTPAIFIFDYRPFLDSLTEGELKHRIWRERLCHPVVGRVPGSRERELRLIEEALTRIARYAYPNLEFSGYPDLELHFSGISTEAHAVLAPAWPNVLVRSPSLRYNISRGRIRRAAQKVLSVLALLHAGRLGHELITGDSSSVAGLLSISPTIRIDHRIIDKSNTLL